MNTGYRAAIGPNDKSSLQCICEMLEHRSRSLCATSTNAGFTFATIIIIMPRGKCHEHDVLACVQYKPARL